MAGMMDLVLYGGLAIVGLNIFKPDVLPDFLQIPSLQNLIKLPAPGGAPAGGDASAGGDTSTPPEDGGTAPADGGTKKKKGRKHKKSGHGKSNFAYAYYSGYGQDFLS